MERLAEHFENDPLLRREFCEQESLDEYKERVLASDELLGERAKILINLEVGTAGADDFKEAMYLDWSDTLSPETSFFEGLYLSGWTDKEERFNTVNQTQAQFFNAAVQQGWFGVEVVNN